MSGKFYITYEEPFAGRRFSNEQMEEVYRDMADKKEYPDFQTWMDDMLKSGVFEELKMTFNEFKNTKEYIEAEIIDFCYEDGEEVCIVDIEENFIGNKEVVAVNKSECIGLIEVVLKR